MDTIRFYAMFPMRLVIAAIVSLMSVVLILLGESWRQEWGKMDFRGYLVGGRNWNAAGF
jgi:hypothetical protein